MRRRPINVFSLSFLDCICCGLGAVILLFMIVNARSAANRDKITTDLRSEVNRLEMEVLKEKKQLVTARNTIKKTLHEIVKTQGLSQKIIEIVEEKKIELATKDKDTLASKEHVNKLKADLKSLEEYVKRLEGGSKSHEDHGSKLRTFVGHGDRQYLTDLKMGGQRIFILVDASASMLGKTILSIIRRRYLHDEDKIRAKKWQHAVSTIDWLTTQLPTSSQFQVYTFNETAGPLIEGTEGKWLNAGDVEKLNETVNRLRKVVPQKGTSLINAFDAVHQMKPKPDNIFLLIDSLPTIGKSKPMIWKKVSGEKRMKLFNEALNKLPIGIPVNIIMYPMEGDPFAASAYWRLAVFTRGSFFCPSRDWP